ncbi:MAG: hypothetical protein U0931_30290 [Vulcanimicrobiota bacterium]
MKPIHLARAAFLMAGLMGLSQLSSAQPGDLLAGGDVRRRGAGIKVGKPRQRDVMGEDNPSKKVLPDSPSPTPSLTPSPSPTFTIKETPTIGANPGIDIPLPLTYVDRAASASQNLAQLSNSGQLASTYTGLGRVAGEMATLDVTNKSNAPLTLRFVPGMVLETPPDSGAQPIMLEEDFSLTLQPGENKQRNLICYCLDYNVPPPEKGTVLPYSWSTRVQPFWADTVKVLAAGLAMDKNHGYHPVLDPLQHRRVVIQRAIWQQLGQVEGISSLQKDMIKDSNGGMTQKTAARLAKSIYGDIEKTLQDAKSLR